MLYAKQVTQEDKFIKTERQVQGQLTEKHLFNDVWLTVGKV